MSNASKTLVRRLVDEVINQGDLGVVDELFAPELAALARQAFTAFRSAFPNWREEIVDLIAEEDKVVARFRCSGTQQGPFMGFPATGRRQEVDEVYILRVKDGRVVDFWGLEDNWSRLQQLGLVKAPTPAKS
jgi:predicted ester cyclase